MMTALGLGNAGQVAPVRAQMMLCSAISMLHILAKFPPASGAISLIFPMEAILKDAVVSSVVH